MKLQQKKDNQDEMELIFKQANIETKEKKDRANGIEQKVVVAYEKIPNNVQATELMVKNKIDQIVQTIDQYQQ
jgi:hypothetical protein